MFPVMIPWRRLGGDRVNRERWLIIYALAVGLCGWSLMAFAAPPITPWPTLLLFIVIAVLIESVGFRVPPSDPHSLVGIVILTAALALGSADGALIAGVSALIFGLLLPLIYGRPLTFYSLVARPLLRSGVRAGAVLIGSALAAAIAGGAPPQWLLFACLLVCFPGFVQLSRVTRELLQGGRTGVITWWRAAWLPVVAAEVAPLVLALLGAAIYMRLGLAYFLLSTVTLIATSLIVRQAATNLNRQTRSVRELALLNEASRAIIRSELDVAALSDLIYREASKVVDTASFHLGLFDPTSDTYTLTVRVQDRVRLPPLTVNLPAGDGLVGWIRQTGQALLVEDFLTEMDQLPARPRYQSDRPPRSGIYVPLLDGETVIGSLSIQSYLPGAFDADDMRLLSLIADQAAVAITKARVFNEARQRAVQLLAIQEVSERITAILDLDDLLPSVVSLIRERFGYHPVHIFLLEEGALVFRAGTAGVERAPEPGERPGVHGGGGIVGAVAESGAPLLVNNVHEDPRYISDDPNTRAELAVPIRFGDELIGVLDVQSAEIGRFQQSDLFVMQTLADQLAVAVESARAFMEQREEAWTLNALLQVAENIVQTTTVDDLAQTIVRLPPLLLGCDRCYFLGWEREEGRLLPLSVYGVAADERAAFLAAPIPLDAAPLLAAVLETGTVIAAPDAATRPEICPPLLHRFGGASLLVAPLRTRGATRGLIVADYTTQRRGFSAREVSLFTGIGGQLASAFEGALLAQEAAETARLEQELRVARDIQTALLPSTIPQIAGWQVAADWRSARIVGGDFYDFWWLRQVRGENGGPDQVEARPLSRTMRREVERLSPDQAAMTRQALGFVIADVSDKGVPAAMFMALARSLVRASALDGSSPANALVRANRWITRDSESGMFVTVFYGILHPESGALRFCCAGHNPPILFRAADRTAVELRSVGIALGVLEEITLAEDEVAMAPDDILFSYTDGVTEATNPAGEAFGVERLIALIDQHRAQSAEEISAALTTALQIFCDGPVFDDVTLIVIKRGATSAKPA
jgi:serine phosphatase RsbU (regulator of sigma subunit)/putative methionine-R-sulfoxide reductase with GAF domain